MFLQGLNEVFKSLKSVYSLSLKYDLIIKFPSFLISELYTSVFYDQYKPWDWVCRGGNFHSEYATFLKD